MITLSIILLSVLVAVVIVVRNRGKLMTKDDFPARPLWLAIITVVVGILLAIFQPYSFERVDAGHVGIKVNLTGDARGVSKYEYRTGWVVFNEWTEDLYEFPTFQQHIDYDTTQVITRGGFPADITPSFNYSLIPGAVGDMFQSLRKPIVEVEQQWLKSAVISSMNDVANKWAVDSIFNSREQFEASVIAECNKRVGKWFAVSQLRTNIKPPKPLQEAIIKKTKALQDVQVAENQKQVAQAEAERDVAKAEGAARAKIAQARGDSASLVIGATAEAEAIKRKQQTLSALYIEYLRIDKWDGAYPATMLGGATPMFQIK